MLTWLLLSLTASARETAPAAAPGWQVDRWLPADGLPLDHLNRVALDHHGYLWITTFDGLSRFDGQHFETWRRQDLPALQSNRLVDLWVAADGSLVFSDEPGAVYRLDPARWPPQPERLIDAGVRGLADNHGVVWAHTDHELWRLEVEGARLVASLPQDLHRRIDRVAAADAGALLIKAVGGLWRVGANGRLSEWPLPAIEGVDAYDVAPLTAPSGEVWLAHRGWLWSQGAEGLVRWDGPAPVCGQWVGKDGRALINTVGGVYRLEGGRWTLVYPTTGRCGQSAVSVDADWFIVDGWLHRDGQRLALVGEVVPGLIPDGGSGVWAATHRGLLHVRPAVAELVGGYDLERPATDALVSDGAGGIWASVARRLVHLDAAGQPLEVPEERVISSTLRETGGAVTAMSREELLRLGADGVWRGEPLPAGVIGEPGSWWRAMAGRDWLAGRDGLWTRAQGGPWAPVLHAGAPLPDTREVVALEGGEVAVLVGRLGLLVGPPSALRVRGDLPSVDLRALVRAGDRWWIGSEDAGLCRVVGDLWSGPLTCAGVDVLGEHNVHLALHDEGGRLWLGTNRGVLVVELSSLEAHLDGGQEAVFVWRLDESDGLRRREVNGGQWAAFRDGRGRLWLPTMGGPAVLHPDRLPPRPPPGVQVEGVWADGAPAGPALSAAARELRVRWSVPELVRPDQVEVRYRLEGVDRAWRGPDHAREAVWTNLPPGTHRLVVQARSGEAWGPTTELGVERPPTFVESPALTVLLMAGAAGATAAGAAWWGRARRRRELALEDLVAARTADLVERNAQISEAAARLEEQSRQLTEVDAAKSRFVANLSHELRTPLMLVMAPLQDLAAEPSLGPLADRARLAARNAERLQELVEQLFDVVRLDGGRMPMRARRLELGEFLHDLVARFQGLGVAVVWSPPAAPVTLWADPDLLDKVFGNLLGNAVKFTPAGGKVEVSARVDGEVVRVRVHDDGPGVPEDLRERIFERFFQADGGDTRRAEGAGIGLSLARELVELHGGGLRLVEGPGACFEAELPLGAQHLTAGDIALDAPGPEPAPVVGEGRRVLVVEDHPELRAYLVSRLSEGLVVEAVADGAAALARLRQGGIDLLLSDIMMPGMDGLQLCRAVRADEALRGLPVVLLSAKGRAAEPDALQAGANAFLPKPVRGRELMAALHTWLPPVTTAVDHEELRRIEAEARAHLHEQGFTVERLAKRVGMSPRTLQRALNRLTGRSPVAWLQELRLEVGREALRRGVSVQEAAASVGVSASWFTRMYGAWFGYPPSQEERVSPPGR